MTKLRRVHMYDSDDQLFLNHIHEEKLNTQKERAKYIKLKLTFVSSLLGVLSSINNEIINLKFLFYILPIIVVIFDNYIAATDSSIKRVGNFLKININYNKIEKNWEIYSSNNRDKYAPRANFLLSIMITFISFMMFYNKYDMKCYSYIVFIAILTIQIFQHYIFRKNIFKIDNNKIN